MATTTWHEATKGSPAGFYGVRRDGATCGCPHPTKAEALRCLSMGDTRIVFSLSRGFRVVREVRR